MCETGLGWEMALDAFLADEPSEEFLLVQVLLFMGTGDTLALGVTGDPTTKVRECV